MDFLEKSLPPFGVIKKAWILIEEPLLPFEAMKNMDSYEKSLQPFRGN